MIVISDKNISVEECEKINKRKDLKEYIEQNNRIWKKKVLK